MQKISYTIARYGNGYGVQTLDSIAGYYAFKMYGLAFGVAKDGLWTVTELSSGHSVASETTRAKAVAKAKMILEQVGEKHVLELVEHAYAKVSHLID